MTDHPTALLDVKAFEPSRSTNRKGGGTPERRFKLIPFHDLRPGPEPVCLVKGVIPRDGLTVVWGPPKSGKSFWVFDLALHVALGWQYRGRRVSQGAVIYCAFEGVEGFKRRAEAFRRSQLAGRDEDLPVAFSLIGARANLVADHPALVSAIRSQLGTRPALVVLDTLNRSLQGSESNDQDMAAYVKAADAIREAFGCAVVIVHHCGINETRPRGHTSLTGAADAQLAAKRDTDGNIIVVVEWMKDGPEGEMIASRLEEVTVGADEDGAPIQSCVVVPAEGGAVASGRKATKLSGKAKAGLRHLQECLSDRGRPMSNGRTPAGVKAVTLIEWREHLVKAGVINRDGNPREEFSRIRVTLMNADVVGIWEDFVWTVT